MNETEAADTARELAAHLDWLAANGMYVTTKRAQIDMRLALAQECADALSAFMVGAL